MQKLIKYFEKSIVITLIILMALIVALTTIELAIELVNKTINSVKYNGTIINLDDILHIFGLFFNVLIGLELFETVKLYLKENVFHAEIILLVGLIAVARKVIILNYEEMEPAKIIGIALLIATLAGGYFLLNRSRTQPNKDKLMP
ncbi:MAG: phosphate-starvation-inducible E-like protein [Marinilabiliales bacterium]|nr:MAG: phosphate-starvation-inducible E-like protein [Marinilabiliales bacterium]